MKDREQLNKFLLILEIITGIIMFIMFLIIVMITPLLELKESTKTIIILSATLLLIIECLVLIKIEQIAGYYECKKCNHRYIPAYKSILLASHIGRTRYMKCPNCNKRSWNKKVLTK